MVFLYLVNLFSIIYLMGKVTLTGSESRRPPSTTNEIPRLGGGFNVAVLVALNGYGEQTPEQLRERAARLIEIQKNLGAPKVEAPPTPTPLCESTIVSDLGAGAMALHRMRTDASS